LSATLKPRTIEVVLLQGDDATRAEELLADVERAVALGPSVRINEEPAHVAASRAYDTFIDEAAQRAVVLTVAALPRRRFRELMAAHPDNKVDADAGFNVDEFGDDLVPECMVTEFPSIADRDNLLDSLSDGQWSKLFSAAVHANRGGQIDPKARLSSEPEATSGGNSGSPARLG
jgi:hypothetical protein